MSIKNILFLIPPSEGKLAWWDVDKEKTSFSFEKPIKIIKHLSEKDLKCSWKRYKEALELNNSIDSWPFTPAIERYDGVMYKAINYKTMTSWWQDFFVEHFLILSGMYGFLRALDSIGNYKLPIEAQWLKNFWISPLNDFLKNQTKTTIVSLLPESYEKIINTSPLKERYLRIEFIEKKGEKEVKLAHGSKKIKWEFIRNICEKGISDLNQFWSIILDKNWIKTLRIYEKK